MLTDMDDRRTAQRRTGDAAEQVVVDGLVALGWTILARAIRIGRNELDIVAIDPGPPRTLVVVEVRWRRRRDFGLAEETVDHRKRARVRHAAHDLRERGDLPHLALRFDLIVVEPGRGAGPPRTRHHRAAF